jgi:hypothetical protein
MPDQNRDPNATKNTPASITVDIDGQPVTKSAEDIQNLIAQQASATQKTQQVAAILQTAEKYGLSPEDLVQQADGAFAVMSDLIEKGIIDNKGTIITKKADPAAPIQADPNLASLPRDQTGLATRLELIEKSLAMLPGRLDTIERDQTHMIRMDLQRSIQAKHSNLSDDDISKLFSTAMGDRSKTIWQHAEGLSKTRSAGAADLRKQHAAEFGIDLDEFDANKLNEKDAEGGAGAVFKGKKFSFKKGDESVSPRQATMEFFKNVNK